MLKSDPWGTDGARWHILGWQGGELPALFGIPGRGKGGQNRWGNRLMRARARLCAYIREIGFPPAPLRVWV